MTGSSPRVWGQGAIKVPLRTQARIIPTRVGTRLVQFLYVHSTRDHPHACGDKQFSQNYHKMNTGSSPRVWGQVVEVCACKSFIRIIPTRVGTRQLHGRRHQRYTDHPHACGDKINCLIDYCYPQGSSPRVWGQD